MHAPLRIENLTKVYKLSGKRTRTAVDSLRLEVPPGVIFGFLGPNGAGKTTTIKIALDFLRPTSGRVTVFGKPTTEASARGLIGYLPEQSYFQKFLKPIEVVAMHAGLAGVCRRDARERAERALERTGIADYADTPISKLSKGLTQRVALAQALVGDPKLLILDEPTSGLDPIGRRHTRNLLMELRDEGKTVFLSSHLLGEVESLCDIIAVLRHGTLAACGAPDDVRNSHTCVVIQTAPLDAETIDRLKFLDIQVERQSDRALLMVDQSMVHEAMRAMEELRLPIIRIDTRRESLEEAFLRLAA